MKVVIFLHIILAVQCHIWRTVPVREVKHSLLFSAVYQTATMWLSKRSKDTGKITLLNIKRLVIVCIRIELNNMNPIYTKWHFNEHHYCSHEHERLYNCYYVIMYAQTHNITSSGVVLKKWSFLIIYYNALLGLCCPRSNYRSYSSKQRLGIGHSLLCYAHNCPGNSRINRLPCSCCLSTVSDVQKVGIWCIYYAYDFKEEVLLQIYSLK